MKKIVFWVAVSVSTFFIGLGFFVLLIFYPNSIEDVPAPDFSLAQKREECVESRSFPGLSKKISELKKGKSGYFPKDNFSGGWAKRDDFVNDWYGDHLAAMQEKSLLATTDETAEIYRFLWLRTFHHPIFVRIERRRGEIELFTKELDGAGGYNPGKVLRRAEFAVTPEDFCKFSKLLEKANFWRLPADDDVMGNDGAQWILEGVRRGRYHAVDRWTPETGEYREACIYLLKLSGVDTDRLQGDLY